MPRSDRYSEDYCAFDGRRAVKNKNSDFRECEEFSEFNNVSFSKFSKLLKFSKIKKPMAKS